METNIRIMNSLPEMQETHFHPLGDRLTTTLLVVLAALCGAVDADDQRPNVIFILADDLGWSDTTLYGGTKFYQTPHIERLAKRGMTFTRAYSASPLCSPTRASILTGLSPARHGITAPKCHLPQVLLQAVAGKRAAADKKSIPPVSASRLKTDHYTLAEALQKAGYATGHFGKWHLGAEPYSPLQHGFDTDIPHWHGPGPAGSYVAPWKFPDFDHDPDVPDQHIEDRMAEEAVRWMERQKEKPFFLNYWMFSVHAPFDAKKALIEKHRARVDPNDPQRCPTYAAMVESMDDAVGTLLNAVDRLGIAERTIIVFASDNGGNMYNEVEGETPTSNAPLRGGKATMYEGGVRGPCVIVWPGQAAAGSRCAEFVQSMDFYPSLLEMTGVPSQQDQEFDGLSLVPALRGEKLKREAIFTYFPHDPPVPDWMPPAVSVHHGDWKLIRIFHGGDNGEHRWKLFHLKDDIGEKKDVSGEHPQRVRELDRLIEGYLRAAKAVRPAPNPAFDPAMYRPEQEGQPARRKGGSQSKTSAKPVAGWRPGSQCRLKLDNGVLVIQSTGGDPHLSYSLSKPAPAGPLEVKLTMSSTVGGRAQLFWRESGVQPAFFRDRSVTFATQADGKPHEYRIRFETQRAVTAIRLDPAVKRGEMRVSAMRLLDAEQRELHRWRWAP